jgi:hypothetical protein
VCDSSRRPGRAALLLFRIKSKKYRLPERLIKYSS